MSKHPHFSRQPRKLKRKRDLTLASGQIHLHFNATKWRVGVIVIQFI